MTMPPIANLRHPARYAATALALLIAFFAADAWVFASPNEQAASNDRVIFAWNRGGDYDLYAMAPGDRRPVRLPFNSRGSDDLDPVLAPDGKTLAFSSNRDGDFEIYQVDITAARPIVRRVTRNTTHDRDPTWSADSKQIAFVSYRYIKGEIFIIPAASC